jgi:hypothetical protein
MEYEIQVPNAVKTDHHYGNCRQSKAFMGKNSGKTQKTRHGKKRHRDHRDRGKRNGKNVSFLSHARRGGEASGSEAPAKLSSNAKLSKLTVSAGTLTPGFSAKKTEYTVNVPYEVSRITVTGKPASSKASINAENGTEKELVVGENATAITVTAEDGSVSTTTVTVIRERGDNADLDGLSLSEGTLSPAFSPETTEYTANVPNSVEEIIAKCATADKKASTGGDAGKAKKIAVGANVIEVAVTAADGITAKKYSVTVTRAGSSKANLAGISLSAGTLEPAFSPEISAYAVNVPNGVAEITVAGKPADRKATVDKSSGVPRKLDVGENRIALTVTAEDGTTTKEYTVTVRRNGSGNADLKTLAMSAGTLIPPFAPGTPNTR